MHCHPNARRTPRGRAEVFRLVEAGMTVTAACLAAGVSRRFYYRWRPAWRAGGPAALVDRSSRPHSSPRRLAPDQELEIIGIRAATGFGPDRIAVLVGLPASTVHRVLRRRGLLVRHRVPTEVVRYEHADPGGLLHVDTKKLGRIVGGPGHRVTGSRIGQRDGAGWEVLHVAIDDATRLVYAELLADEKGRTAARFLVRALRWYRRQGDQCPADPVRQRGGLPEPGLRASRPPPHRPPQLDPPVPAPDQRQGRALDPDRPVRVALRRGLQLVRGAGGCARPVRRVLQRRAPSPGPRWTDTSSAASAEIGRVTDTNVFGDYT